MILAGTDWPRLKANLGLPIAWDESPAGDLPLHPALPSVMFLARELAVLNGDEGSISTDHVLLALLAKNETLQDKSWNRSASI